ncbi:helix-turn-helix domain-containing protein [Streptomyces sp. NPDC051561]|uniref:helix-turn-helix domain-containing protein n=1 Tax=Streptomyces sp. NPDC051561 TaxID=3365658 RepID=UPI00379E7CD9
MKTFHAPHGLLNERHVRVLDRFAQGDNGAEAARALGLSPNQVYRASNTCGQYLGVSGRCALVHASYLLGIVPRPAYAGTPLPSTGRKVIDADLPSLLGLLAMGMTHREGAWHLHCGLTAWWLRIRLLQHATGAVSTHHLITMAWQHQVLGPAHVHTAGGATLTPAPHLSCNSAPSPPGPQLSLPTSRSTA